MEHPLHDLRDRLAAARLDALKRLAAAPSESLASPEGMAAVRGAGELHLALLAIRDDLAAHEPRVGYGSERPLE
jgi:hypothetical protein